MTRWKKQTGLFFWGKDELGQSKDGSARAGAAQIPPPFFFFGVGLKQISSASDVAASPAGAVTNQKEEERARAGKAAVH